MCDFMVELLSPVRDFSSLSAAIKSGADAVYLGLEGYNMRAHAANFRLEDLKKSAELCHKNSTKLYICTNTIMKNKDIKNIKEILPDIKAAEADAIIVSDLGVLRMAQNEAIDVHMSVQANLSNLESLKLLKELGVKRVILSRELSLLEIKEIVQKSSLEVEVFIHGAMCLAISGRCFLSSYLSQKSANCGECLQPCRKEWQLVSEDNDELILGELLSEKRKDSSNILKGHILSPRDLCMVENIPELIDAEIDAFKIEGRARPADYVATVTRVYREAIDSYQSGYWEFDKRWLKELGQVYNRGFDTGFYYQTPHHTSDSNQATIMKKDIGEVCNYYSQVSAAEIRLWDDLELGEEILIQGPTTGSLKQKVESMRISGKIIQKATKGQHVGILVKEKVRPNDILYKRIRRPLK
jgi:U32 family peptidase